MKAIKFDVLFGKDQVRLQFFEVGPDGQEKAADRPEISMDFSGKEARHLALAMLQGSVGSEHVTEALPPLKVKE